MSEVLDDEVRRRRGTRIAELAIARRRTIAVAESLTGGMIAGVLAESDRASEWFCGALVAYSSEVKHELLGVPAGPVVSAEAAAVMAGRVRELMRADIAVAVTGAGGPSAQDGQPPGTVFLAVADGRADGRDVVCLELPGDPTAVCRSTTLAALDALIEALRSG